MGGLRLKWAGFVGLLVCFVTAGCGGTQTITQTTTVTETKTVTRTVVHHSKAPVTKTVTVSSYVPPGGAAGTSYPSVFASRFNTACFNAGVYDPPFCHCALTYIEAHVPFSTVRAEGAAAFGVTPPRWFTAAQSHCAGK